MWIAAGFATMVAALAAAVCLVKPARRAVVRGGWPELHDHVAMLCEPRRNLRGLRVQVPEAGGGAGGTAACLRVMRERRGLRLELPATSDAERAFEPAFRKACEAHGMTPSAVTRATDRNRFIMALHPADAAEPGTTVAGVVAATFASVDDPEIHVTLLF